MIVPRCIILSNVFFQKSSRLWDMWRQRSHRWQYSTVYALCMLNNKGYRHTHGICNTAFRWQNWLDERASILSYTHMACLVNSVFRCFRKIAKGDYHVCPHGTTRLPLDGFSWNFVFEYFSKNRWESSSFIKIGQEYRVLYMKTNIHLW